jgi:serine/threonine protein kinase
MGQQQDPQIGKTFGEYRLLRRLGGGTFGTVYQAEHLHHSSSAAVKVLRMQLTHPKDFRDFINEARLIRFQHPHIVPVLDFGVNRENVPYLVMEYAPGGTLRDRHRRGERLPLSLIVSYTEQLASALYYAHQRRVIHRDVKPENILFRSDGTLLLSDFGIAKVLETSSLVSLSPIHGTPAYMAPEQSQGKPGAASDQYALAVVLYEWITGRLPFQGSALGVVLQHRLDAPPALTSIVPDLPPAVEQIVLRALAKNPAERFATIQDFATALRASIPMVSPLTEPEQVGSSVLPQTSEVASLTQEERFPLPGSITTPATIREEPALLAVPGEAPLLPARALSLGLVEKILSVCGLILVTAVALGSIQSTIAAYGDTAYANLCTAGFLPSMALLIVFIIRAGRSSLPVSKARKREAGIGQGMGVVALTCGMLMLLVAATWEAVSQFSNFGVVIGTITVCIGSLILSVTRIGMVTTSPPSGRILWKISSVCGLIVTTIVLIGLIQSIIAAVHNNVRDITVSYDSTYLNLCTAGFLLSMTLLIIFVIRARRSLLPVSEARKREAGIGLVAGVIAFNCGMLMFLAGVTWESTRSFYGYSLYGYGIVLGVITIVLSLLILLATRIRTEKTP